MKKNILSIIMATGLITSLYSQAIIQGPITGSYYSPNTTGATSSVAPNTDQQQRQAATASINFNPIGAWPSNPAINAAIAKVKDIWDKAITSAVPINIDLVWDGTLAGAPTGKLANTAANVTSGFSVASGQPATVPGYYYPKALANKLHGSELNSAKPDATIYINNKYSWNFTTDQQCPNNKVDFVTTLLHETAHALGFFTSVRLNPSVVSYGFNFLGSPNMIMEKFIVNTSGTLLTSLASPSTALTNFCTSNAVNFNGTEARYQNGGVNPKISAPNPFADGGNINHWDKATYPKNNPNTLLTPDKTTGEAVYNLGNFTLGLLKDIGWTVQIPPIGIEDRLSITSAPALINENQLFNAYGTFYDEDPYGDYIANAYWKLEVYHATGKVVVNSASGINSYSPGYLGTLPTGYNWLRDFNTGALRADFVLYGTDNDGTYHETRKRVGINYRPETPVVAITQDNGCNRNLVLSFYAKGATSYRILYANAPGVNEGTQLVMTIHTSGNANTESITFPYNGTFYLNVRGLNNGGNSALGNEVNAYMNSSDPNCNTYTSIIGTAADEILFSTISPNNYAINFPAESLYDRVINIYSTNGQVVSTRQSGRLDTQAPLDLNNLANGMYLIKVTSGGEQLYQKKVIITH